MALSTVDADGLPNARMVLLKEIEGDGFVFYTNFDSTKGQDLLANPRAALCFHWKQLARQVRIRGDITQVPAEEADAYYASRDRGSRIGAWASKQSRPLKSRASLVAEVAKVAAREGANPKRPPFWGGFRIVPAEIEFWADGEFRLHDRFRWTRTDTKSKAWTQTRLNP